MSGALVLLTGFRSRSDSNTFKSCGQRFCYAVLGRDQRSWPLTPRIWPLGRFQLSTVLLCELLLVLEVQLVHFERRIFFEFRLVTILPVLLEVSQRTLKWAMILFDWNS